MDPARARALLTEDAQEVLGQVASGLPVARLSVELERASAVFQALACCGLLEQLDADAFRIDLLRSAHARLHFLRRSAAEGNQDDRRLALSRTEALFDALAAGHDATIDALLGRAIPRHVPGWEYEEDHLYHRWIGALYARADQAALQQLARDRRAALQLPPDTRQSALEALGVADEAAFIAQLHRLAAELLEQAEMRHAHMQEFDLEACLQWPRAFVSVELLALIALARRRGLRVDEAVPLAPFDARLPSHGAGTEDFFEGIARILAQERGPG